MANERLMNLALERLRDGELPRDLAVTTLGGASRGESCRLCRDPLHHGDAEIELVWATADAAEKRAVLHPACHGAWLFAARSL